MEVQYRRHQALKDHGPTPMQKAPFNALITQSRLNMILGEQVNKVAGVEFKEEEEEEEEDVGTYLMRDQADASDSDSNDDDNDDESIFNGMCGGRDQ